ncbi:MAG: hypothetical protein CV045_07240 [Cyanobacteria bacterium M5B4]|nr:MAG: hypothetical protein CV045_07240 [Cyanobacteria bacterium M5B4]
MAKSLGLLALLLFPSMAGAENLQHLNQLLMTRQCQRCDLTRSGLVQSDLSRIDVMGSDLTDANLGRTNLRGANLQKANLSRASLFGADLTGADLRGANLSQADLGGANLTGANLAGAIFAQTDLRQAILTGANFDGVDFRNAYVRGAVDIPLHALKAEEFYLWGMEEGRRKNPRGAIENFNRSITLDNKFAPAFMGRAVAKKELRDLPGAIEDAKQAEQLFQSQNNPEGVKLAQELAMVIQNPPQENKPQNHPLSGIFTSLGSVLLPFLLR